MTFLVSCLVTELIGVTLEGLPGVTLEGLPESFQHYVCQYLSTTLVPKGELIGKLACLTRNLLPRYINTYNCCIVQRS